MSKDLHSAVLAIQSEIGTLQKNAINPHFKSRYISLENLVEAVQPLLTKHGLIWACQPSMDPRTNVPVLGYSLIHAESGESIGNAMPLLLDKQNAQGLGSAITYARRYALCAVLNIVADVDDDGNRASDKKPAEKKPADFVAKVRAAGIKGAQVREWAGEHGFTLDDVGTTSDELVKFLNNLKPVDQTALLAANG